MAKQRGNPNWGKPEPIGPIIPTVTEFEQVVKEGGGNAKKLRKLPPQTIRGNNQNAFKGGFRLWSEGKRESQQFRN